jgi:hypothetical protein
MFLIAHKFLLDLLIVKIIRQIYLFNVQYKKQTMKTFILKSLAFGGVIFLLSTALTTSSCKKDKTCHGKVHVVDSLGKNVGNAFVRLAAPSVQGDVKYDGSTDNSGNVSFEVKLPAIFDVTASKATYPNKLGVGVLRLDEPGKSSEVEVTIR